MEIDITPDPERIRLGLTGEQGIVQNVRTIMATTRGTVPLDRSFGISGEFLDKHLPVAQAMYAADVVAEVEKQEPRVKVTRVYWMPNEDGASDGELTPVVRIKIKEGQPWA